jgi:hypothetical protein
MSHNGTGRYIPVRTITRKSSVSKSTYAYVLDCVQRYRAVQQGTGQYTKWYRDKAVQIKVQQGTRQYMAVHVSTRSSFAPGRWRGAGGGGRFWCAFEIAALTVTAPTVASASSHCMHKLDYSSLGALARASPASATAPPFATVMPPAGSCGGGGGWRCRGRRLASRSRSRGWRRHIPIPGLTGALGLRGGGRRDVNMWRRRGV